MSLLQVLCWEEGTPESDAERVRVMDTAAILSGLKGSTSYLISVRAQNSAGAGPSSPAVNVTTKKPRESSVWRLRLPHSICIFSSFANIVSFERLVHSSDELQGKTADHVVQSKRYAPTGLETQLSAPSVALMLNDNIQDRSDWLSCNKYYKGRSSPFNSRPQ